MKKHLIYYVYPANKTMLLYNLEHLQKYYATFTGEKHCVIAVDNATLPFTEVKKIMCNFFPDLKIYHKTNVPALGETAYFPFLLSKVITKSGLTFYAHAKGVTRKQSDMRPILKWIEKLYSCNLAVENIDAIFKLYDAAGSFRVNYLKRPVTSVWHFSGTYFWLKNSALRKLDWKKIDQTTHGVESYPGKHFPIQKSYCIAFDNSPSLYYTDNWQKLNVRL